MNATEKAAIARNIADYIIDHLLVEEPMNATELNALAIDVTEDRGITDASELESIAGGERVLATFQAYLLSLRLIETPYPFSSFTL